MRYYSKKQNEEIPAIFRQWLTDNAEAIQAWIADSTKTGDHLWEQLGKTFGIEKEGVIIDPVSLRHQLENALYEEQNGLCCYCGNTIERNWSETAQVWEYFYRAIEHFVSKHRSKSRTFDYNNLMQCCKESQRLNKYEIGRIYHNITVNSFGDVQRLTGLPKATIINYYKNRKLNASNLNQGEVIHVPYPPHCDDEKSKYDGQNQSLRIINPTVDNHLIELLIFTNDGKIDYSDSSNDKNQVIENTLKVLALNCDTLLERRKEKWLNAYVNYYDANSGILTVWINESVENNLSDAELKRFLTINLQKLIENKANPDENGRLEAFYFVEVAFLKSLFNGEPV